MNDEKDINLFERTKANHWVTPKELVALLPTTVAFKSKGSIDRYGFARLLAQQCNPKLPFRPFGEWVHGWMWDEQPSAESLALSKINRNVPIVLRNKTELQALKYDGFSNVHIGGLPFAYVGKQHRSRNPHALLAFPPHSSEAERVDDQQSEYLDYLISLQEDFDGIYISIFGLDWGGALHQAAERRGLKVVFGALPDDANSLRRTRSLLDAFSFVTSNTMGSHFVYASSVGCQFSFCGPQYRYSAEVLMGSGNPRNHTQKKVDRLVEIQSKTYLHSRFGKFYVDHPSMGIEDSAFGQTEIGLEDMLSIEQIRNILGFSLYGQFRGHTRGVKNRILRGIRRVQLESR